MEPRTLLSVMGNSTATLAPDVRPDALRPTTTTLISSQNPSGAGTLVVFTATVAPTSGTGTPTGTVVFTIDGTAEPAVTLLNVNAVAEAQFLISTLLAGVHTVQASYSGDATFAASADSLTAPGQAVNVLRSSTALVSSSSTSSLGKPVTFTATVSGGAQPTGTVEFRDGSTRLGTAAVGSSATATLTVSNLSLGSHSITADYLGNGILGPSTSSAVTQVVTVAAPTVKSLARFGFHSEPTSLVLTFSTALEPTTAQDVKNYTIVTLGGTGRGGSEVGHVTPVREAVYNGTSLTVTLFPAQRLDLHNRYRLTVNGTKPGRVTGVTGLALDGRNNGVPGSNYVAVITAKTLAGAAPTSQLVALDTSAASPHATPSAAAYAVDALSALDDLPALPVTMVGDGRHRGARR
jgi:hypothetical protein